MAPPGDGRLSRSTIVIVAASLLVAGGSFAMPDPTPMPSLPQVERKAIPRPPSGPHKFAFTQPTGAPVRWNPCEPVHYVVNTSGAPAGALADVQRAFAHAGTALGMQFIYDGPSTESAVTDRQPYQPERYGKRWAPILVNWQTLPARQTIDTSEEFAVGVPVAVQQGTQPETLVSGHITMNAAEPLKPGFVARSSQGTVLMHEIGHVMGLDHVDNRFQIMYPYASTGRARGWGVGDRFGLYQLGAAQSCLKTPKPSPVDVKAA